MFASDAEEISSPTNFFFVFFFFNVKMVTLNFLLSPLCGPPFTLVTEPRSLTMDINLISARDLAQSASCDRSQAGESLRGWKATFQRPKLND